MDPNIGGRHSPAGRLNTFLSDQSQRDIQWRHTFDATSSVQLSWGIEFAREGKPFTVDVLFPHTFLGIPTQPTRFTLANDNRIESSSAYLSSRTALSKTLDAQADLFYQDTRASFVSVVTNEVNGNPCPSGCGAVGDENRERELNPRVGIKWRPHPSHTVRLAAQVWRKPPGVGTLAPVDTVGIPLDDQTVTAGGRLKRARMQHEIQLDPSTFAHWFVDLKEIRNLDAGGAGVVGDLELVDLEKLRTRRRSYGVRQEYLEDTPEFDSGRIKLIGVSFNRLVSRDLTLAGRYVFADTNNTSAALSGRTLPFHPRHYANLSLNWRPYGRWIMGTRATYRSRRFADDANTELLSAGWALGLSAYWESDDKRLSVGGVIDQIVFDTKSSIYRDPVFQLRVIYRFQGRGSHRPPSGLTICTSAVHEMRTALSTGLSPRSTNFSRKPL